MCVIIAKKAGVDALKEEYFDNAWDRNPDGGGIVWKEKGKRVMFQKGFMKKEDMLEVLKKINTKDTSFIAHFRIKSVGDVKPENCHPFVMKNVTFAHNGTLGISPIEGKTDSETFGLAILYNHTLKWIKDNKLLLEMALGTSKFAIMDNTNGEIFILNPELGKERDGAWFSNDSAFTPVTHYKYAPTMRWGTAGYDDDNYHWPTASSNKTKFVADKTLGTKAYTENQFYEWDDQIGAWYDNGMYRVKRPYQFVNKVIVGRNGIWKLEKNHTPGDDLEPKSYGKKSCAEYSYLMTAQNDLNKLLASYKASVFNSWDERNDMEEEIHALGLLLNACRRLVVAGKALSLNNLYKYVYEPINDASHNANTLKEFMTMLSFYMEDCTEIIAGKTTKLNDREVKQVCACAANA